LQEAEARAASSSAEVDSLREQLGDEARVLAAQRAELHRLKAQLDDERKYGNLAASNVDAASAREEEAIESVRRGVRAAGTEVPLGQGAAGSMRALLDGTSSSSDGDEGEGEEEREREGEEGKGPIRDGMDGQMVTRDAGSGSGSGSGAETEGGVGGGGGALSSTKPAVVVPARLEAAARQETIDMLRAVRANLQPQLFRWRDDAARADRQRAQAVSCSDGLREQIASLSSTLEVAQHRNTDAAKRATAMGKDMDRLKARLAEAERESEAEEERGRTRLREAEERTAVAEEEAAALREQIAGLRG